jgi:hypothetical protein
MILWTTIIFISCQDKTNKELYKYKIQALNFIKEVKQIELKNPSFILVDEVSIVEQNINDYVSKDTLIFTKEEITYLQKNKYPKFISWNNEHFPKIRMIKGYLHDVIFEDYTKGWDFCYKYVGNQFHYFSSPIFLRNYTYCLFYSGYSCGELCGTGELNLYKNVNNKWVKIKNYTSWIS